MKTVLCCLLLIIGIAFGDYCINYPSSLPKGSSCANSLQCAVGLYCGQTGQCTPTLPVNSPCNNTLYGMCGYNASCIGPVGAQQCVAYANPGDTCSTNTTLLTPQCGTGTCLNSGYLGNGVCSGGFIGDYCGNSTHCLSLGFLQPNLNCTNNVCSPIPIGGFCSCNEFEQYTPYSNPYNPSTSTVNGRCLQDYCVQGSSCQGGYCTAFLASGAACSNTTSSSAYAQCPPNNYCVPNSVYSSDYVCTANGTLTPGSYCDQFSLLCSSGVCFNKYCAKSGPQYCYGGCSLASEVCTCNGQVYYDGVGTCVTNPCYNQWQAYASCLTQYCVRPGYDLSSYANEYDALNVISYAKSCVNTNCMNVAYAYYLCNEGSRILPFLAIFLALLALFHNTH